jgi:CheY-like chemotaxis protein
MPKNKLNETNKRILIVLQQQQTESRLSVRLVFNRFGCIVDIAEGGCEAIKLVKNNNIYDFLITELLLDEVSGLALCAVAKKNRIHAIAINNGPCDLRAVAREAGIDMILDPPQNKDSLTAAIGVATLN